jgi:Cu/Ag efflux protein CusF
MKRILLTAVPCALPAILAAALIGCNRGPAPSKQSNEPLRQYSMRGSVLRLDPQGQIATIKNEKIEGWMESMTMDFPVKDQADFAKLHPGDTIRATVFVQGLEYWVGKVQGDNAAPAGSGTTK